MHIPARGVERAEDTREDDEEEVEDVGVGVDI